MKTKIKPCNHPVCDNEPGKEFKHTGFCGKHQQLNFPDIERAMSKEDILKLEKIDQAEEAIIEIIERDGRWSDDLPAGIQEKLETLIKGHCEVLEDSVSYMLWENTIPCLRDENVGETYDSSDSMLYSAGNSVYLHTANQIENSLEALEKEYGEFQIEILPEGEIMLRGDKIEAAEPEEYEDLTSSMRDAWRIYESEKEELLSEDALKDMAIESLQDHGIKENFLDYNITSQELLEAYEEMKLEEQDW